MTRTCTHANCVYPARHAETGLDGGVWADLCGHHVDQLHNALHHAYALRGSAQQAAVLEAWTVAAGGDEQLLARMK